MSELSPAAQAMFDTWIYPARFPFNPKGTHAQRALAAALRALADHQQVPITNGRPIDHWSPDDRTRRELRNLAAELEGHG